LRISTFEHYYLAAAAAVPHAITLHRTTLQHTAKKLQHTGRSWLSPLALTATHCNKLQQTSAIHLNLVFFLRHRVTLCNAPQHTAAHCNTPQLRVLSCAGITRPSAPQYNTATHCNTLLQHTSTSRSFLLSASRDLALSVR